MRVIPLSPFVSVNPYSISFLLLILFHLASSEIQVYRYVDEADNLISKEQEDFYRYSSHSHSSHPHSPSSTSLFSPTPFPPFRPSAVSAPPPKRSHAHPRPVYVRPEPSTPSRFSPDPDPRPPRPNPHYIPTTTPKVALDVSRLPSIPSTTPTPKEEEEEEIYPSSTHSSSSSSTFSYARPSPTPTPSPTSTPIWSSTWTPPPRGLDPDHSLGMGIATSASSTPPRAEVFLTKGNTEETETIPLGMSNPGRTSTTGSIRDILITPAMVRNGSQFNHVVLLCNASYPIEWVYRGVGAPMLYTAQIRSFGNFFDPLTYGHSSIVVLVQDRLDERQTGSYVCRGINKPGLSTGFHLYFKGEFGFPSLQNVVIQPETDSSTVLLPCPSTDPSATIGLYKVAPYSKSSRNLTLEGGSFAYDPRTGFSLALSKVSDPYGTYICKFNELESDWKISVVPPKYDEVQVWPNGTVIQMDNLTDHSFVCRGQEPLQIMLPNTVDFGRVEYSTHPRDPFPYLARLTITPSIPLFAVANYFKINCQSRASRRVLHSWEYSNFGPEVISVTYDSHQKRLLCCSKSGLTPRHEMAKCETVTDCGIKAHCFASGRCDYAFPPRFVDAPRGCTAIEFMDDFPSHVMRCSVGGGEKQVEKTVMVSSNIANDNLIIYDGSVPETEEILKIVEMNPGRRRGRGRGRIQVRCVGSIFYFSTNILFAFQGRDGSLEFADDSEVENVNSYGPTLKATPPPGTTRVICFAPLTRSSEWRNASLDISTAEDGRFAFPAVAKSKGSPNPRDLYTLAEEEERDEGGRGTLNSEEDRIVTSVKASTSVRTFLRKKKGHLIRVMQDI